MNLQCSSLPQEYCIDLPFQDYPSQGERGTCAAFTVARLLECALKPEKKFSVQYLYACCKHSCGEADREGCTLHGLFASAAEYGVIYEDQWAYNQYHTDDETQIAPERLKEFSAVPLKHLKFQMLFDPKNVEEYKQVLSGRDGHAPMAIAAGFALYPSVRSMPNGFMEMPSPGEETLSLGGHAMLIYGYKDAPHIAGGGYFLAVNSWDRSQTECQKSVIRIPYAYIRQEGVEAGTLAIPEQKKTAPEKETPDRHDPDQLLAKYLSKAASDMKDVYGVYSIKKSNMILTDPNTGKAVLDTPENRRIFIQNGFCLQRSFSPALREKLQKAGADVNGFSAALDMNIAENRGKINPYTPARSFLKSLFLPRRRFIECREAVLDQKLHLLDFLQEKGIIPRLDTLTEHDKTLLEKANSFRIYRLSDKELICYVVALFITGLDQAGEEIAACNATVYSLLKDEFFTQWKLQAGLEERSITCFSMASPEGWAGVQCDGLECLSVPPGPNGSAWHMANHNPKYLDSLTDSELDFMYSLFPVTFQEHCAKAARYVDVKYMEDITLNDMADELKLDPRLLAKCADKLQEDGNYVNYMTRQKEQAIRKKDPSDGKKVRKVYHSSLGNYEKTSKLLMKINLFLTILRALKNVMLVLVLISQAAVHYGQKLVLIPAWLQRFFPALKSTQITEKMDMFSQTLQEFFYGKHSLYLLFVIMLFNLVFWVVSRYYTMKKEEMLFY